MQKATLALALSALFCVHVSVTANELSETEYDYLGHLSCVCANFEELSRKMDEITQLISQLRGFIPDQSITKYNIKYGDDYFFFNFKSMANLATSCGLHICSFKTLARVMSIPMAAVHATILSPCILE